jgi:mitochondrial intermediate peptidase
MKVLIAAKQAHEGKSSKSSGGIAMWDLPYYMGMVKAQQYRIDSRVLAAYFPLERCLDGLALLCRELFGLELRSLPMEKHEAWHPDVQKLGLQTASGETIGFIYFDLYPRPFKYTHAAHFTIRCGKRISESEYQKPLVALVCNFNKPAPSSPSLLK